MATPYFQLFDNITVSNVQMIDMFKQISLEESVDGYDSLFNKIIISDQDSLESIAERFYGSKIHYWILMLSNKFKDPFYDWPLKDIEVKAYAVKRLQDIRATYASDQAFMDAHYSFGQTGDDYTTLYAKVQDAIYTDLLNINDAKKTVYYLKPKYLQPLLNAVKNRTT